MNQDETDMLADFFPVTNQKRLPLSSMLMLIRSSAMVLSGTFSHNVRETMDKLVTLENADLRH